ncbi:unnamed protein product [Musa acuminata var. zebrina]
MNYNPADSAKEHEHRSRRASLHAGGYNSDGDPIGRLSATDISALASMKNVAKCDTWCELQNP